MYEVDDGIVAAAVQQLPPDLLSSYAEFRAALEVAPHDVGQPLLTSNPDGLRTATLGRDGLAIVTFGVLGGEQRRVVVYQLTAY